MASMIVSLPDRLNDWVDEHVKKEGYASASYYVRALIQRDLDEREALVAALVEGERSGTSARSVETIVAAAKLKLANGQV